MSAGSPVRANLGSQNILPGQMHLRQRWNALGARERRLVLGAALIAGGALLWWIALGPALATLGQAGPQHSELDAQLQQMRSLKAQASALAALPRISVEDTRRALDSSLKQTLAASAQMSIVGNRAMVTLKGASPDALAQWLLQVRINARAVPSEVRLVKAEPPRTPGSMLPNAAPGNARGPSPEPGAANSVRWDGTVVLTLPER